MVDRDHPEGLGERALPLEEAGIGHQPVKEDERAPLALVRIGDPSAVRCREVPQPLSPGRGSFAESRLRPVPAMPQDET
jgi:hypothetical protein